MISVRTAPALTRAIWGALLALLLALRLIGATGYMPGDDHGRLTVIVCPDADVNAPLAVGTAHHHHGHLKHNHNNCPYAAAAAVGALGADFVALIGVLTFGAALLLGRSFLFLERNNLRRRPPTRAPPIPA